MGVKGTKEGSWFRLAITIAVDWRLVMAIALILTLLLAK